MQLSWLKRAVLVPIGVAILGLSAPAQADPHNSWSPRARVIDRIDDRIDRQQERRQIRREVRREIRRDARRDAYGDTHRNDYTRHERWRSRVDGRAARALWQERQQARARLERRQLRKARRAARLYRKGYWRNGRWYRHY